MKSGKGREGGGEGAACGWEWAKAGKVNRLSERSLKGEGQPVGWVSWAPFKNSTQGEKQRQREGEEGRGRGRVARTDTDRLAGKETEVFSVDTELNLDEIKSNMAARKGGGRRTGENVVVNHVGAPKVNGQSVRRREQKRERGGSIALGVCPKRKECSRKSQKTWGLIDVCALSCCLPTASEAHRVTETGREEDRQLDIGRDSRAGQSNKPFNFRLRLHDSLANCFGLLCLGLLRLGWVCLATLGFPFH